MVCSICLKSKPTHPHTTFGVRYIAACEDCLHSLAVSKRRPYSRIMDAAALAECGYFVNRKKGRELHGARVEYSTGRF